MPDLCRRFKTNPLMVPEDLKPSRPDFIVTGVLNAGAFRLEDQYCWLVRVAEAYVQDEKGVIKTPQADLDRGWPNMLGTKFHQDDPELDLSDTRIIWYKDKTKKPWITNISHLRLARSDDGMHWRIDDSIQIVPSDQYEQFGVEDPRVVCLANGTYAITYSAISRRGVTSNLITTRDFKTFDRKGPLFVPDNKDIAIFPEKVKGQYIAFHRPSVSMLGKPEMWLAFSPDLVHWGGHECIMQNRDGMWDSQRIGCGPEPIKTEKGWLAIYHGSDDAAYYLGAVLLDLEDPRKVIARSKEPILSPQTEWEKKGFYRNVVFANGQIVHDDGRIWIYYGAADRVMAGCEITLREIFRHLGV